MVEEILFTSNLDNEKRLYEIIAQLKSRLQMVLNSSGHTTAVLHAMSYFSNVGAYNEALGESRSTSWWRTLRSILKNEKPG